MPIVTRKAFAELCGDAEPKINVWIGRGKINVTQESKKLIDTEDPKNHAFVAERQMANTVKEIGQPGPKADKNVPKVSKTDTKPAKSDTKIPKKVTKSAPVKPKKAEKRVAAAPEPKGNAEIYAQSKARLDQDMQKKALEIENLELAKQQKLLFLNKSAGQLLPVDLVKGVLKRHADVIIKSFENDCEKMATVFCNIMAGGDQTLLVRVVKESKEILSACIARAGLQADEEVIILIKDYSQRLERGQKRT